jgi:ribosomal protein L25 (general stress protein Ctc)
MRRLLAAFGCLILTGIAGYSYYLQTPNYALRQMRNAAARQDHVALAKYVDFENVVLGFAFPLEATAEARNKNAESLERMQESTADQLLKSSEIHLNALRRGRMPQIGSWEVSSSVVQYFFEHFDSDQVLSVHVTGDTARVMVKDVQGNVTGVVMSRDHKIWHVTRMEMQTEMIIE